MRGFVQNRNLGDGQLGPEKFSREKNRRYTYEPFDGPAQFSKNTGNAAATGATGDVNSMITSRGNAFEYHIKGAGQTIIVPVYDYTNGLGWDVAHDVIATEGVEYGASPNIVTANMNRGKHSYKIADSAVRLGFYAKWQFYVTDASGLNPLFMGFLKHQAYQTANTTYTDYAGFKMVVSAAVAKVNLATNLNNAGEVLTDTTQTIGDAALHTWEVRVRADGYAYFLFDNAFPTVTKTNFQFDAGDIVRPAFFLLHGADASEALFWQHFEAGYFSERP